MVMTKKAFVFCLLMAAINLVSAQKVDTIYYDNDWKGIEVKEFASFVRYALYPKDINARKLVRDYYISGELQGEGEFISIDKSDDSNSIFTGENITYYKNGKKSMIRTLINGVTHGRIILYFENGNKKTEMFAVDDVPNGIATVYNENGNVDYSCNMVNGKFEGIYTKFFDDGISCSQVEMKDGEPITPYYTYNNKDGVSFKVNSSNNSLYLETPGIDQKKNFSKDGTNWEYYSTNGLFIAISAIFQRDYGKYLTLNIVVSNYSPDPIQINSESITAFKTYKGNRDRLTTLSNEDYMNKVNRSQQWSSFFNALGESMAASSAGYSSSTTSTSTAYANSTYSTGIATVVGTAGAAVGAYGSNTINVGAINSTTNSSSYNGAAAYQANMIANQRIRDYNVALNQERQVKEEGYLKQNTINSGETISGYVNIKYEKSDKVEVYIDLNTIKYPFIWTIDN